MNRIEVISLVPKFLSSYDQAFRESLDSDRRWELWNEVYRFAAVPPGDEGTKMARTLPWMVTGMPYGCKPDYRRDHSLLK